MRHLATPDEGQLVRATGYEVTIARSAQKYRRDLIRERLNVDVDLLPPGIATKEQLAGHIENIFIRRIVSSGH
jgi:hypothetical protein